MDDAFDARDLDGHVCPASRSSINSMQFKYLASPDSRTQDKNLHVKNLRKKIN